MSLVDPTTAGISRLSRLKLDEKSEDQDANLVSSTAQLSIGHNPNLPNQKNANPKNIKDSNEEEKSDWNRIHTRLVFYTIGRPIYRFRSVQEILEAFYDAIDGKIHSIM